MLEKKNTTSLTSEKDLRKDLKTTETQNIGQETSSDTSSGLSHPLPSVYATYPSRVGQLLIFLEFYITIVCMIYVNKPFYNYLFDGHYWLAIITPLSVYGFLWQFAGFTLLFTWVLYKILVLIEPPKEGIFSLEGREFRFFKIRFWIMYYCLYVARMMPLPWADMIAFRIFKTKVGKNVVLYDSWIDPEFVSIGDYVMVSLNTVILSHSIYDNKFIVKPVVLEKSSIAGAEALVSPGSYLEESAILGAGSNTYTGQRLARYLIHVGTPVKMTLPIKIVENVPIPEEHRSGSKKSHKKKRKD